MNPITRRICAAAAACAVALTSVAPAWAATGENTPLDLGSDSGAGPAAASGAGGGILRMVIGLLVVVGVIYGTYWVLKQVKASKETAASGQGLTNVATLPLGPGRSVNVVRAGNEVLVLGVGENGVTTLRSYTEDEAEAVGLVSAFDDDDDDNFGPPAGHAPRAGLLGIVDELRRRTIR